MKVNGYDDEHRIKLTQNPVAASCKHGNAPCGSVGAGGMEGEDFLNDY
jgi:hypothetical protein